MRLQRQNAASGAPDWRLDWRLSSERLSSFSLDVEATRREAASYPGSGSSGQAGPSTASC